MKKRRSSFRRKRFRRLLLRKNDIEIQRQIALKKPIEKKAPYNFSLIDNTSECIKYLNDCKKLLHKKEVIYIDIEQVINITPDAIALLAACTNDESFRGRYGQIQGNAPKDRTLSRMFIESGFYNFVNSNQILKKAQKEKENLFHKESHFQVQPNIAKEACLYGTKHVFSNVSPLPELYEMLIEAMSNTNNHANKTEPGSTKWWLYVYNAPEHKTCYSFIDLGVGIFDSLPVSKYKKMKKAIGFSHNADLVSDLLNGKIKSREKIDNKIRGKGIPQIAYNSSFDYFFKAFIISNDVKIDLKTKKAERIKENFSGTILYWELINNNK